MHLVHRLTRAAQAPFAAPAFYALCALMLPVMLVGYAIMVVKIYLVGRRSGSSTTAQGPLFARWLMHELGLRQDRPARRLLLALPSISHLGLGMTAGPLLLAHRLTGYVPTAFRYPFEGEIAPGYQASARVTFFDAAVERYLAEISQFVILGSGFDTRALRLPRGAQVRPFEVDMPRTLATKRRLLSNARVDTAGVTFVPADFERDDWLARLVAAGFDPGRPAVFLWEGVTMYLNRAAIEATLRSIAGTAPGSVVAFDFMTTEMLTSQAPYWRYARAMTKAAGEPMTFGVDSRPPVRERVAELLHACGLALIEQRTLGHEGGGQQAWGGFAIAAVPART
jgi:methyltransferase (TIGR00027 family)